MKGEINIFVMPWRARIFNMGVRTILSYGDSKLNRLKLLVFLVLNFVPTVLKRHVSLFRKFIDCIVDRGLYVLVGKLKYFLVDGESLLIVNPTYEHGIRKWITPKKQDVFVDIGANVGKYALPMSRLVEKVVALEPMPQNYRALRRGIEENKIGNIVSLRIAGWNKRESFKLFLSSSGGCSLKHDCGLGHVIVQTERIDDILNRLQIGHVDWFKIDVEGSEVEVLEGMGETLMRNDAKVIIEIAEGNKARVFSFMENLGYKLTQLEDTPILAYYFGQKCGKPN